LSFLDGAQHLVHAEARHLLGCDKGARKSVSACNGTQISLSADGLRETAWETSLDAFVSIVSQVAKEQFVILVVADRCCRSPRSVPLQAL
jgi:hypothetical protein